eukprot:TRINITY_DN9322_c1_g1_i1.p1 TRINITY_DN9322_c1_g1~~TRINITY_DN9322_c1_g1_i1.p1  ORF type:complete len:336 (+),score=123.94 TRINITY_DN9322_c1_g1_i1:294-1301(+)
MMEWGKERQMYQEKVRSMEENMRFLEEMMMEGGGGGADGNSDAALKLEQSEVKLKQLEDHLKQTETKMRMKSQQENELGKVIKHLEEKCMEEQYKNNQAQEEIKRLQSQTSGHEGGANVWRQKYLEEAAKHKATQEDLAQTEVLLAEQSQVPNNESEQKTEEKLKKLEERFRNIERKARAMRMRRMPKSKNLPRNNRDAELIQSLTNNCQEAALRLHENKTKLQEQEEAIVKYNSLKGKYEYKINFLEEKLKKASDVDASEYESKIKGLEKKLAEVDGKSSKQYEAKIAALEEKYKETEQKQTKTLMQQTNNIRNNYEDKIKDLDSKSKQSKKKN